MQAKAIGAEVALKVKGCWANTHPILVGIVQVLANIPVVKLDKLGTIIQIKK